MTHWPKMALKIDFVQELSLKNVGFHKISS